MKEWMQIYRKEEKAGLKKPRRGRPKKGYDSLEERIRKRFWIKEQKRGKRKEIVVNSSIRETLDEYFAAYPEIIEDQTNFIFFNTKAYHLKEPIKRGQAWKVITTICNQVGLSGNFSTHNLRKT